MSKLNRRTILAGAAALAPASAVAVPVLSSTVEPDPIYAAIEAYRQADAAFIARAMFEDELAEKGIRLAKADGEYRTAEMVAAVNASIDARVALAKTVPTTPAGLIAFAQFVREQSVDDFLFTDGLGDSECRAFATSIERAARAMAGAGLNGPVENAS